MPKYTVRKTHFNQVKGKEVIEGAVITLTEEEAKPYLGRNGKSPDRVEFKEWTAAEKKAQKAKGAAEPEPEPEPEDEPEESTEPE